MKRIGGFLFVILLLASSIKAQDTVVVQTLTYDSTARAGVWTFPSDTNNWRKILMQYSMRCHDALVGNGNVGCREWDYSCNTFITDSSRTDSLRRMGDSHNISNFSGGSTYNISGNPTYTYTQYEQVDAQVTNVTGETSYTVGAGVLSRNLPFKTSQPANKSQFLWTASELGTAGMTAGDIDAMRLDLSSLGSSVDFLRIRIKATSKTSLDANDPDTGGFTEVFFHNTSFGSTGLNQLQFHTPFAWNGTDNLIVEFSHWNSAAGTDNNVNSTNTAADMGMYTNNTDAYLEFTGSEFADVSSPAFSGISNEITISFWSWGGANLPVNTTIFEGTDNNGDRQANVHLPWSNSRVYWDCGNDGTGYDRIDAAANAADFKDRWTHWAFTKDAVSGEMKIWMDGQLFHSGTGKTRTIDMQNFRIGRSLTGSTAYWGNINEFRVWSVELDSATIRDWMYKDVTASHPNWASLVSYYKLDEGTGTALTDASASGGSATIQGAPVWRELRSKDLYRNFSITQERPNAVFMRGNYTLNLVTTYVLDSVLNAQNRVIEYTVNGTDLTVVDTNYYYQAGYQYIYDESGNTVDSILVATDSTINISTLTYFDKYIARYEIMSFVTPYGNGLDLGQDGVMWEFDMTDFAPILHGTKRMSMEYGGQNQEEMDIRFLFIRGTPPRDVHDIQEIWKTGSYGFSAIINDDYFEERAIKTSPTSSGWKVRTTITGHGQNGEFIPRWSFLDVNGGGSPEEFRWREWTECADIPTYPQGGTWLFDRAGWCPGAPSDLEEFEITPYVTTPGDTVRLDFGMDNVSNTSSSNYRTALQFVEYGAPNFALDAAIEGVKRPSMRERWARYNPACNEPVVILKNEGSTTLTSATITYNVRGGATRTFNWTGSLEFLESEEVVLPADNPVFWQGTDNVFEVQVSAPNGGTDLQPDNDYYHSPYENWDLYSGYMDLFWRTNNNGTQTTWKLYDETGAVIMQNSVFLTANYTYTEVFNLTAGCYTLRFDDSGDDGLYYWFTPGNGLGWARIRETGLLTAKNFESEFGKFFQYDFYHDGTVGNTEITEMQRIGVYPNPSQGQFNLELEGYGNSEMRIEVYDLQGRVVHERDFVGSGAQVTRQSIDLSGVPAGNYLLKLYDGEKVQTRQLIRQ